MTRNQMELVKMLNRTKGNRIERIRLHFLVFLAQMLAIEKKLDVSKRFNYTFYRWNLGPYSYQLDGDLEIFAKNGLVYIEGGFSPKTSTCVYVKRSIFFPALVEKNEKRHPNVCIIAETILRYINMDFRSLIHQMKSMPSVQKVELGNIIVSSEPLIDHHLRFLISKNIPF